MSVTTTETKIDVSQAVIEVQLAARQLLQCQADERVHRDAHRAALLRVVEAREHLYACEQSLRRAALGDMEAQLDQAWVSEY